VIVHGRNPAKLQAVRDELSKEFPALKFRVAVANAFLGGEESKQSINQFVKGLEDVNLKILVNNVGGLPTTIGPRYKSFEETSFWENDMMLAMNVDFPTQLTCALLPLLVKHQPSLIITLGSLAEYGNPWLSMYSGSKAFLMSWCRALARELKAEGKDVEVLGILTGEVTDCSHNKKPATLVMPDARTYARATVDKVGCGQVVVNGHFFQGFLKAVVDRLPDFIVSSFLTTAMRRMKEEDVKDA
jgi:short-subunit dehydrogenase